MCGRYYVDIDADIVLGEIFESVWREAVMGAARRRDFYPTDLAVVLTAGGGTYGQPAVAEWGFRFDRRLVINARSETVMTRPSFRGPFEQTRCLVPASGFYEWTGGRLARQRHTIRAECGPLFFAGITAVLNGTLRFVILTGAAAGRMVPIHTRQPVTIRRDQIGRYLSSFEEAARLIESPGVELFPEADDSMGPVQRSFFD